MAGGTAGLTGDYGPSAATGSSGNSEWNAGTVNALGTGLSINSGTLNPQWQAGSISAVGGGGLTVNAGTLVAHWQTSTVAAIASSGGIYLSGGDTLSVEWNAGTVSTIGSGLTLTSGTLIASGGSSEWNAGTVNAIGSGLTLTSGTLTASGASGTNSQLVTFAPFTRPALSSFTWMNQGAATATDTANGPLGLSFPANTDNNIHGLGIAPPSAPWTLTVEVEGLSIGGNDNAYGAILTDGTKFVTLNVGNVNSQPFLQWLTFSAYNSSGSVIDSINVAWWWHGGRRWLRLYYSGTQLTASVSNNGVLWLSVGTVTASTYLGTITLAGFGFFNGNGSGGNYPTIMSLNNFELTSGTGSTATFQASY